MTDTTNELNADEMVKILERVALNKAKIKELEEENDTLVTFFKERPEQFPAGTSLNYGPYFVRISENARIDDKKARQVLGPKYEEYTKLSIDTAKLRKNFGEDYIEKMKTKFANKIEIGIK